METSSLSRSYSLQEWLRRCYLLQRRPLHVHPSTSVRAFAAGLMRSLETHIVKPGLSKECLLRRQFSISGHPHSLIALKNPFVRCEGEGHFWVIFSDSVCWPKPFALVLHAGRPLFFHLRFRRANPGLLGVWAVALSFCVPSSFLPRGLPRLTARWRSS